MRNKGLNLGLLICLMANWLYAESDVEKLSQRVLVLENQVAELREIVKGLTKGEESVKQKDSSFQEVTKTTFGTVFHAIKLFNLKRRKLPSNLDELVRNRFLVKPPKDGWGNDLIYVLGKDKKNFEIISYGADKKEGGVQENEDLKLKFP